MSVSLYVSLSILMNGSEVNSPAVACPSSALLLACYSNVIHYPSVNLDHSTLFVYIR